MKVTAILVAAGSSRRMGFDKLAAELAGESVLNRSLLAFERCPTVAEIRVVTAPDKMAVVAADAARLGVSKFIEAIAGGAERHLSVAEGLARLDGDPALVAVHDAARPLVSSSAIIRCAEAAAATGAATLARRVADTLKRGDQAGHHVVGSVSRDDLWAMETPQIFRLELLREAYAAIAAKGEAVTDEVSAVEALGHPVRLVENPEPNFKITVPADLAVAEALLRESR